MYEIWEDIYDILKWMGVWYGDDGEIVFFGWVKMVIFVKGFKIMEVKVVKIGENKLVVVIVEVSFIMKGLWGDNWLEWDVLKEYDVLFLLIVRVLLIILGKDEVVKLSIFE